MVSMVRNVLVVDVTTVLLVVITRNYLTDQQDERRQIVNETTRRAIVEQILHSNRMEGLEISEEQAILMEEWIHNNITIEDMIEQAMQRYAK